jgi:excisionase family DNA binding protein
MAEPLPLADAAVRLRRKPGRPPLSDEERARREDHRRARAAAATASARLLDVHAAAAYLGVSAWTVRDLIARDVIRAVRIPITTERDLRRVLVDRTDLDRLIDGWKT